VTLTTVIQCHTIRNGLYLFHTVESGGTLSSQTFRWPTTFKKSSWQQSSHRCQSH